MIWVQRPTLVNTDMKTSDALEPTAYDFLETKRQWIYIAVHSTLSDESGGTKLTKNDGRAIAQAVSRLLPTAAARVRAQVWSSGICGGQSGAGAGFLRVLRFPLPIFIPPNCPSS
jgi:hypothetical protein